MKIEREFRELIEAQLTTKPEDYGVGPYSYGSAFGVDVNIAPTIQETGVSIDVSKLWASWTPWDETYCWWEKIKRYLQKEHSPESLYEEFSESLPFTVTGSVEGAKFVARKGATLEFDNFSKALLQHYSVNDLS